MYSFSAEAMNAQPFSYARASYIKMTLFWLLSSLFTNKTRLNVGEQKLKTFVKHILIGLYFNLQGLNMKTTATHVWYYSRIQPSMRTCFSLVDLAVPPSEAEGSQT